MSHKAGHIIIEKLMELESLTAEERAGLMVLASRLEAKDSMSTSDRLALAWLVYRLAKD